MVDPPMEGAELARRMFQLDHKARRGLTAPRRPVIAGR
ncbi:MAG: hypothetical protein ACJAVR_000904 [Paracoccaceae bacterium]|jgi:hypothetical protein